MTPSESTLNRWLGEEPALDGVFRQDAAALEAHVGFGEELLAGVPRKAERDVLEAQFAERVLDSCRRLRGRFMHRHAEAVYAELTHGLRQRRRLDEVAYEAADLCPGLVPTRAAITREREQIQSHKDAREIDQGIFFRGLLRSPSAGAHLADAMLEPTSRAARLLEELQRTGRVELGSVLVERREYAAHLTINNPKCLNAEDDRLTDDLEVAVDLALLDERVRVGVLRGGVMTHARYAGKRVFSAGIHLGDLQGGRISFVNFLLGREFGYLSKIRRGLLVNPAADALTRTVQKPWVAAVDAFAIGGGMQALLVFDRVIAAKDAYFSLPAAQEGIVPGASNFRLTRLLGSRLPRQMVLGGRKIFASDPEARLLCDEVVSTTEIDAAIDVAVRELGSPAVVANRSMLSLAEEPVDRFREYMAEFAYLQATRLYSRDVLAKVDRAWRRSDK